jgi:hypothetical protein
LTLEKTNAARRVADMIQAHGVDYERAVQARHERKRESDRNRKINARRLQTPEQRGHESARKRTARTLQTPEQRERQRELRRSRKRLRPFMGVDGEGGGTDKLGRQNYFLMMAANSEQEHVFSRRGAPLSVCDCLDFLLSLAAEPILVGYGIGYDATQILRGIKAPTLRRILNLTHGKNGPSYTYWGDYGIIYQQGQYLRVARVDRSSGKPAVIKGSCRTVYETLGFFQCTFVKAITNFNIGSESDRSRITKNKMRRAKLTKQIIEYCKLECRYLAMLMTEFREVCAAAGIEPRQWSGAGWLASALLDKHGVPKRPLTAREAAALQEKLR